MASWKLELDRTSDLIWSNYYLSRQNKCRGYSDFHMKVSILVFISLSKFTTWYWREQVGLFVLCGRRGQLPCQKVGRYLCLIKSCICPKSICVWGEGSTIDDTIKIYVREAILCKRPRAATESRGGRERGGVWIYVQYIFGVGLTQKEDKLTSWLVAGYDVGFHNGAKFFMKRAMI